MSKKDVHDNALDELKRPLTYFQKRRYYVHDCPECGENLILIDAYACADCMEKMGKPCSKYRRVDCDNRLAWLYKRCEYCLHYKNEHKKTRSK